MSQEKLMATCPKWTQEHVDEAQTMGISPSDILNLIRTYGPQVAEMINEYGPIAAKIILQFVKLL